MNFNDVFCPELIAISYALYVIGTIFKKTERIPDKKIPVVLSLLGIIFCNMYVLSTGHINNVKLLISEILIATIQGICAAGMSVYVNQLIKQIIYK
jgi:hypothetical protein